jgi:streptogramin lyase
VRRRSSSSPPTAFAPRARSRRSLRRNPEDTADPSGDPPAWAELSGRLPKRATLLVCFALTFATYLAFLPRFLMRSSPPTGDQPYYLMDAASLAQDGDLNVKNNYDQSDFDKFYGLAPHAKGFAGVAAPYPLQRQLAPSTVRPAEEQYSFHLPGLGLYLAPAWKLGGLFRLWWPATLVFMCVVGALIAVNVFLLAFQLTGRGWVAWAVWAPLAFSGPLMTYSYMIFTELPVGLLLVYAFRRLAMGWDANGRRDLLLVGLSIGYIPWLAWRCVPLSVTLALYGCVQWRRARRAGAPAGGIAWAAAPVAASALLVVVYSLFLYGRLVPIASVPEAGAQSSFHWPWEGMKGFHHFSRHVVGLLYDSTFGLLPYAPVYVLAGAGLLALFASRGRADRRLAMAALLVVAPYSAILAGFMYWTGIWCPPARYLATLVPLAALPLAYPLASCPPGARRVLYMALHSVLSAWGIFLTTLLLLDGRLLWPSPPAPLFERMAATWRIDLRPFLPSLVWPSFVKNPLVTGAAIGASLLVVLAADRWTRRRGDWRAPAALPLYGAVVLGAALLWAGDNEPYLRRHTLYTEIGRWPFTQRLPDPGGIAFLDGKIYIASRGRLRPDGRDPGMLWRLDLRTGGLQPVTPSDRNGPVEWTFPADVKVGPRRLLYVLNNAPGARALLVIGPDGAVAESDPLNGSSNTCSGLYVAKKGDVYVSDTMGGSVLEYGPHGGDPTTTYRGGGAFLNNPFGTWVDEEQYVYTTESFDWAQQLHHDGRFVRRFELECSPRYFAQKPGVGGWLDASCGAAIVSLDTGSGRVHLPRTPQGDLSLPGPMGLTYAPDGTLYVVTPDAVVAYSVEHGGWSRPSRAAPLPTAVVARPTASAPPTLATASRAAPAAESLEAIRSIDSRLAGAQRVAVSADGRLLVLAPAERKASLLSDGKTARLDLRGADEPSDVAFGPGGNAYILDSGGTVRIFRPDGAPERVVDLKALGVYNPRGLDVTGKGEIAVADTGGGRVLVCSAGGRLLRTVGRPGGGPGELNNPVDVALDGEGGVVVADAGNRRILRFDSGGLPTGAWRWADIGGGGPRLSRDASGAVWVAGGEMPDGEVWRMPGSAGDVRAYRLPERGAVSGVAASAEGNLFLARAAGRIEEARAPRPAKRR